MKARVIGKQPYYSPTLNGGDYAIPEGYEAEIKDGKVIVRKKESEDERIMKDIITILSIGVACDESALYPGAYTTLKEAIAYLEKQKEQHHEWSLQDEKNLDEIFCAIRIDSALSEKKQDELISWLQQYRPYMQKEQKSVDSVSREEYVKKFKVLCDAYEIKLPNREYDIYHLCDDLSKLFVNSDDAKLRGSDIEELEWLIEEYRTWEPDCSEHQLYELIASEYNRRHFED